MVESYKRKTAGIQLIIQRGCIHLLEHLEEMITDKQLNDILLLVALLASLPSTPLPLSPPFLQVSIHGIPKTKTWTRLATSAVAGDDQITLQDNDYPDWVAGEEIVIAPSSFDPEEAEIRTILSYNAETGVVTLDEALEFDHQVHNFLEPSDLNDSYPEDVMEAWWGDGGSLAPEVGLLTHNIIIQG